MGGGPQLPGIASHPRELGRIGEVAITEASVVPAEQICFRLDLCKIHNHCEKCVLAQPSYFVQETAKCLGPRDVSKMVESAITVGRVFGASGLLAGPCCVHITTIGLNENP